ncbi:MAG TPA: hypothetical protein VK785_05925 [Opitutaceae bacterium]|nr:hypothetical protein [Opitutaceae bacterium]
MPESETSGAASASAETAPPAAAFGASRGSGLARGKRPAAPAPATTTASNGEYRPTAIEVVASKSDYKNPFAEPAPAATVDEVKPTPAAESPAPTASVETKPIQPATFALDQSTAPVQPAVKPQLNILPSEEPKRTELSWEAGSPDAPAKTNARPRREDRPVFRAERPEQNPFEPREQKSFDPRDQKPFEPRGQKPFQPREPRDSREPRREQAFEPRRNPPFEQREPRQKPAIETAPKKSGGFLGWLKGLFGGGKPATTNGTASPAGEPGRNGEQRQHRRRHRGGRGGHFRQGDPSRGEGTQGGFRSGQPQSEGRHESNGEHREGGQGGGQRRRRRRGGRGGHFRQGDQSRGEGGHGGPQGS